MIVVMLITAVETTGDVFATGEIVREAHRARRTSPARCAPTAWPPSIGGVLNSFPYTCFAENVGLVRLTRVKSRYVVATAGGNHDHPRVAAEGGGDRGRHPAPGARRRRAGDVRHGGRGRHPDPVPGATSTTTATWSSWPPAWAWRMYVTAEPDVAKAVPQWAQIIFGSGITLGSITAIVLNLVFHHIGKGRGPAVAGTPGDNLVRLAEVNNMSSEEFVRTFAGLFQGPDWMVERAYAQRPFTDTHDLRRSFQEALFAATPQEQEQLISSYPDLGAMSVAIGEEGEDSQSDQSVLGLTRLAEAEHQELAALTKAYRDRFGFTLIMAVRDQQNIDQLLRNGWERLNNSPTQEHAAALIEIAKIATHRFDRLVADANPIQSARTRHLDT